MGMLVWVVGLVAIVLFFIGGAVKAMGFLLWIAPILLVVAIVLFFLNRGRSA